MYNYRVLYAEDDLKTQSIFKRVLETLFVHVSTAENGEKAIERFKNEHFDIVITDINMPETDGLEFAKFVKSTSPDTPVLIVSAFSDYSKLSYAIELGIDGYILKPINADQFMVQLTKITKKLDSVAKYHRHETLLKEYKEAIDRSSIVSKTNSSGIITYVNDAFTQISQYEASELLGKPHNIIRHPDMPSSVYEDLWRTIKAKNRGKASSKTAKKMEVHTMCKPSLILF